eukprot:6553918-Alexandrium_andersonii.AAC.1
MGLSFRTPRLLSEVMKELTSDVANAVDRGFVDVATEGVPEETSMPAPDDEAELLRPAQSPDTMPAESRPDPPAGRAAGS